MPLRRTAIALVLGAGLLGVGSAAELAPEVGPPPRENLDAFGDPLPPQVRTRFGTIRFRQGVSAHSVSFSPDGKFLVSQDRHGWLRAWDPRTGKEICDRVTRDRASTFAISSDGQKMAYVTPAGKELRIRDIRTGQESALVSDRLPVSKRLGFTPDGKALISVSFYGVTVWDVAEGKPLRKWEASIASDLPIALSRFATRLAACPRNWNPEEGHSIRIWDVTTGKIVAQLGQRDMPRAFAFSPDGRVLAVGSLDTTKARDGLCIWDATSGKKIRQLTKEPAFALAFSPDGKRLAVRGNGYAVELWDWQAGTKEEKGFPDYWGYAHSLDFSPDGKLLAAADWDKTVAVWDVATRKRIGVGSGHTSSVTALGFSPDGASLLTRGSDYTIRVWDVATGVERRQLDLGQGPPGREEVKIVGGFSPHLVAFSSANGLMAAHNPFRTSFDLWDVASGKRVGRLDRDRKQNTIRPTAIAFSPDGRWAVSGCIFHTGVEIWSLPDQELRRELDPFPKNVRRYEQLHCVAWSPDGRTIASGWGGLGLLRLWDARTGRMTRSFEAHDRAVLSLAFSPDGKRLLTAGDNNGTKKEATGRLWETATGLLLREWAVRKGKTACVAFSPDNRFVAAVGHNTLEGNGDTDGDDRTVRVWDSFTGEEVAKFVGHRGNVNCVAFAPNGKALASGSDDTTALLCDVSRLPRHLPPPAKDDPFAAGRLWDALADADGHAAMRAVLRLAAEPDRAVPLLRDRLRQVPEVDPERVKKWVADLDHKDFRVREAASKGLAAYVPDAVEPLLRKALEANPSAEARSRLEALLGEGKRSSYNAESVRRGRAVLALELIGTAEAREVLRELAAKTPANSLTRDAEAALKRAERFGR